MKNFIVIVFLLLTARAHGGVWYYGTGEAVNVENQIGFEKEKNVKFLAEADDLIGSWFGNKLSLDPSRSDDNLLRNGSFENGIVEYTCTDATAEIIDTDRETAINNKMLKISVTTGGGGCTFVKNTGVGFDGVVGQIKSDIKTSLIDVDFCEVSNTTEQNCIEVSGANTWRTYGTGVLFNPIQHGFVVKGGVGDIYLDFAEISIESNLVPIESNLVQSEILLDVGNLIPTTDLSTFSTQNAAGSGNYTKSAAGLTFLRDSEVIITYFMDRSTGSDNIDARIFLNSNLISRNFSERSSGSFISTTATASFFAKKGDIVTFEGSNSNTTATNLQILTKSVMPTDTMGSVGYSQGQSYLRASSSTVQDIYESSIITPTYNEIGDASAVSISSGEATVLASGYYRLSFSGTVSVGATDGALSTNNCWIEVNGTEIPSTRAFAYVRYAAVTGAASARFATIETRGSVRLNRNDVVRVRCQRVGGGLIANIGRTIFEIAPAKDPNGERVVALSRKNYVSGGIEQLTPDTWDEKPIYRRCWDWTGTVAPSGTPISTQLLSNIGGITPLKLDWTWLRTVGGADLWQSGGVTEGGASTKLHMVYYDVADEDVVMYNAGDAGWTITRNKGCIEYTKP